VDNFKRLPGKALFIGLRDSDTRIAVCGTGASMPSPISRESNSRTAKAFRLSIDDINGKWKDDRGAIAIDGDDLRWNNLGGESEYEDGNPLESVPFLSAGWFVWMTFFSDTELL
jgi:hypothetical protein